MPLGDGAACVTTTGALKRPWLSATCWDSELPFGASAGLECRDGLVSFQECLSASGFKISAVLKLSGPLPGLSF